MTSTIEELSAAELLERLTKAGFQPVFAQRVSDELIDAAQQTHSADLARTAIERRTAIEKSLGTAGALGLAGLTAAGVGAAVAMPAVVIAAIGAAAAATAALPLSKGIAAWAKSPTDMRLDEMAEKTASLRQVKKQQEIDAINGEGRLREMLGEDSSNEALIRWAEAHAHKPQKINAPDMVQAIVKRIDHQFRLDSIAAAPDEAPKVAAERDAFRKSTMRLVA